MSLKHFTIKQISQLNTCYCNNFTEIIRNSPKQFQNELYDSAIQISIKANLNNTRIRIETENEKVFPLACDENTTRGPISFENAQSIKQRRTPLVGFNAIC